MKTIVFKPRNRNHLRLPVVTPACLEGGPLETVPAGTVIKLREGEILPLRAIVTGGVIAEFYRQLLPVPEGDFIMEGTTDAQ